MKWSVVKFDIASSRKTVSSSGKKSVMPAYDLSILIENIKDAVIVFDKDYVIQNWNLGATDIYGWSAHEATGQKTDELLKTDYESKNAVDILHMLKSGESYEGEIIQQRKSGEQIYVYMSASALYNTENRLIGFITVNKDISENKKAQKEIQRLNIQLAEATRIHKSELKYVFERITEGFIALNKNWIFTYVNRKASNILNNHRSTLIGRNIWEEFPETKNSPFYDCCLRALEKQEYTCLEAYHEHQQCWVENHIYPSVDGVFIYIRDITEKKKTEAALNKSNRLYHFISQINQMILRSDDESTLFREACSIAIEIGKYRMACIGLIDESTNKLNPVILNSTDTGYIKEMDMFMVDPMQEESEPAKSCIRENRTIYYNNIENDLLPSYWRKAVLARDYRSVISLPIKKNKKIIGTFSLYADSINHFDEEEISLLEKVTDDINFGVENIERETKRRKAESILTKSNEQLILSQQIAGIGYWEQDLNGDKHFWSEEMYHLLDRTVSTECPNLQSLANYIHPDDRSFFTRELENSIQHKYLLKTEFRYIRNDGSVCWFAIRANILYSITGVPLCLKGTLQDITQLKKAQYDILNEKKLSDSVINGLPGIFFLYTSEGKFIRWNRNLEKVSGYSPEEIGRLNLFDFFTEKEKPLLQKKIANAFENKEENVLVDLLLKSKETIPYYFTVINIMYEEGNSLMGIGMDFSERQKNLEELETTSMQLQDLSAHLITIREEERKRIGRELHDELGQQLTAMKMDTAWINKKLPEELIQIKDKMANVIQLLDGSNTSIRRILSELRPAILDEYGLMEALQWYAGQFRENTGICIQIICQTQDIKVAEEIGTCIFRVFQESLTNITRYAKATNVLTRIDVSDKKIKVSIIDNGIGFNTKKEQPKSRKSFGLLGMKERVRALNGSFALLSKPGSGTEIRISLPLFIEKSLV